jgi:hypothetical protein
MGAMDAISKGAPGKENYRTQVTNAELKPQADQFRSSRKPRSPRRSGSQKRQSTEA